MINVFAPEGALTRAQVELLTEKLTHELLVIESVDNDASRGSRTVLGAPGGEIPPGDSTLAAAASTSLKPLPRVRSPPRFPDLLCCTSEIVRPVPCADSCAATNGNLFPLLARPRCGS